MKATITTMKHFKILVFVLAGAIALSACDTKTSQETKTAPDSAVTVAPPTNDLNSNQSDLLRKILGENEEGVLRGVAFGDPISKVKATETFEMFEETGAYLGYTLETTQLETIDVQYFLTPDKKVNKITVDVYLNSPEATKELWNASRSHFTEIYSKPREEARKIAWNNKSVKVNMEDVSEGKDYGLKFQFFPTDKNVLASK